MNPKNETPDLSELVLVLKVKPTGEYEVVNPLNMCTASVAVLLRCLADEIAAAHPPYPCQPGAADAQDDRADEPLDGRGGRLDDDRHVWTDGRGHSWDLSLAWGDVTDREWRWTGAVDNVGHPMMRAVGSEEHMPLDVLRVLYGPIAPVGGA
ncbi:phiSA1p31-related protein [Streptomyces sp. NPDC049577]|uniref:phiSA1p31-related protein n=1 Tax=Streptomyces sp. NPDC049577 TaxID=3155153 RepID=UPI00341D0E4E